MIPPLSVILMVKRIKGFMLKGTLSSNLGPKYGLLICVCIYICIAYIYIG